MNFKVLSRFSILIVSFFLWCGCNKFWQSTAPNFASDPVVELVVIWDTKVNETNVVASVWKTTNSFQIDSVLSQMEFSSWESLSIIAASHPTRILLLTKNGAKWEVHWFHDDPEYLSLFNVAQPGRSGLVLGAPKTLLELKRLMEADLGNTVDLQVNYKRAIAEGKLTKSVSSNVQEEIDRFARSKRPQR